MTMPIAIGAIIGIVFGITLIVMSPKLADSFKVSGSYLEPLRTLIVIAGMGDGKWSRRYRLCAVIIVGVGAIALSVIQLLRG
jgi:hypothetical protein